MANAQHCISVMQGFPSKYEHFTSDELYGELKIGASKSCPYAYTCRYPSATRQPPTANRRPKGERMYNRQLPTDNRQPPTDNRRPKGVRMYNRQPLTANS